MDDVGFLGTMSDETLDFSKTNTLCGSSPKYTVKVYALCSCLSYNNVKDYKMMGVLSRDDV